MQSWDDDDTETWATMYCSSPPKLAKPVGLQVKEKIDMQAQEKKVVDKVKMSKDDPHWLVDGASWTADFSNLC